MKGIFVTIEGSSGVGKSSVLKVVTEQLQKQGIFVFATKEPTEDFSRENEELYVGETLFHLIIKDRRKHLERDIIPALSRGNVVISDRYIESSLVYQRLDGLDLDYIWSFNQSFLAPHLSVMLFAPPEEIDRRLGKRKKLSRFERETQRVLEIRYYKEAANFLKRKGFNILPLENKNGDKEKVVRFIIQRIQKEIAKHET